MDSKQKTETATAGVNRRDFIKGGVAAGVVVGGGLGAFYFGYDKAVGRPLRVGVIGTGDEGSVLLGAINPDFIQVKSIADIRPYNVWRAFHGDHYGESLAVRPGLMTKYGWKTEEEARRHVKVYEKENGGYEELLKNAKRDGLEAVIIALPLHLHAPAAIAAMQRYGLHVLTEKLMGHSVRECKDMARTAELTGLILATGHQRHYNILYANAVDEIQRGTLGDLHYIRAQWNRGNMPGKDSWRQAMPPSAKPHDDLVKKLMKDRDLYQKELNSAAGASIDVWRSRLDQVDAQLADKIVDAEKFGYEKMEIKDASGKVIYQRPAIEELIRWRLWDRTGAGLMAELGSHQLDAAGIFIHAMHKAGDPEAKKPHPLNVLAVADRPLFPADRDIEDHVYCVIEFPAPGYDPKDPLARRKKIGVQYSSINGNGFGEYGEVVFGTKATLVLEREQDMSIIKGTTAPNRVKVTVAASGGPTLDTQASGAPTAGPKVSRGYTEELEHWAWCIRHPDPKNQPRCGPQAAMADAIIALTTNRAARKGERIEFNEKWFDIHSDETPEGFPPSTRGRS